MIHVDGTIAYVVDDHLQAWHARAANATHLGVELIQPNYGDPFTQMQYRTCGWWLRAMSERYGFPLTMDRLPFHSQLQAEKSDPYRVNDPAGSAFRSALAVFL